MAGFTDSLRGDGLARAQRALARLEGDPLRLDRERQRFSHSPPPYTSNPSGSTTRSPSPISPSEELRLQRRMQLAGEHEASEPRNQFSAQLEEERRRIWNTDPSTSWRVLTLADLDTFREEAREIVKKRWVDQGIWNNKWHPLALGRWKHEEPLELESESETNLEENPPSFSFFPREPPKPKRPKSDKEKRQIAEQRAIREREREASRPYHQFIYQISKERERIQDESTGGESTSLGIPDINTRAYENVRNTWTKRGIWNKRWGTLPGMSWKHEEPFEEETAGDLAPQANPVEHGNHEVGEATLGNIFGRPDTDLSECGIFMRNPSPVQSNHGQASSIMNSSQQAPPADIDSARLENGNTEHPPSAPNSPRPGKGKRARHFLTGEALRPSKRTKSEKEEQPQPVAGASLGSVDPSNVSKAAGVRKSVRQPRPSTSQSAFSGGLPLSVDIDVAHLAELYHPPYQVNPRRSKRKQPPAPSIAKDLANIASTDPSKRAVRSKPEQKVTNNLTTGSSAKPQGVSKRQPAKTTRGR